MKSLSLKTKLIWLIFLTAFLISGGFFNFIYAQENSVTKIDIYFFSSAICPHCKAEKEFFKELKQKYPEIEIKEYEVLYNQENQKILKDFYEKYQVPAGEQGRIPAAFTPTKYFIGFNEQIGHDIENCLKECLSGETTTTPKMIKIPFWGQVDISKMSLPVLTITIGALDGFNPCAMWILLFLIALLINTRSRKRMFLVGGTFIAVSGIVYFLLLSAWLNLFLAISYVNLTRILIGVAALGFGIWQIKSFLTFKPGVCKVTDGKSSFQDRIKNGLKNHAEKLALFPLTLAILGSVIILAFGINLVEFFCSAGLPAIYTRVLTLSQLSPVSYYLYLLLYTFIFILDDLIVFSIAAISLSKVGFTDKYNRWSALIGGLLILILGILLVFRPELLMFG